LPKCKAGSDRIVVSGRLSAVLTSGEWFDG